MNKNLLVLAWPVGFIFFLVYFIGREFVSPFPDIFAYPIMIASNILMLIGCFYIGYCSSKGLDPFKFYKE